MTKVSLCVIYKDEVDSVKRLIESIAPAGFDEFVLVNTNEQGEAFRSVERFVMDHFNPHTLGFRHYVQPQVPFVDFAKARNEAFKLCRGDLVMWLDSDDELIEGKRLVDGVRKMREEKGVNCFLVDYDYEHDENGNCTTRQTRERIVDPKQFEWKSPIHECMVSDWGIFASRVDRTTSYVRHNRLNTDKGASRKSLERNKRIFDDMLSKGPLELRMLFYHANTLMGLEMYHEAVDEYDKYIELANVPAEKYAALCSRSICCENTGHHHDALESAFQAMKVMPGCPTAHSRASNAYLRLGNAASAIVHAQLSMDFYDNHVRENVSNPTGLKYVPHFNMASAYAGTGQIELAVQHFREAEKVFSGSDALKALSEVINKEVRARKLTKSVETIYSSIEDDHEKTRLSHHLPRQLKSLQCVSKHLSFRTPANQGKKVLAIYCGSTPHTWDRSSLETGIGGSENAVIFLSQKLSKMGYLVEVYGSPEKEHVDEHGVIWRYWYSWDPNDYKDTVIWWRHPQNMIQQGVLCGKSFVWLHDMPHKQSWPINYKDYFDGVFTLSDFHRENYSFIDDDSIIKGFNGISESLADWKGPTPERKPYSIIYPSCPTRGLSKLLRHWPAIKEKVPEATLDIFYGWNKVALAHKKTSPHVAREYDLVEKLKDQDGVTWHGSVSQSELAKRWKESAWFVYPMTFPEIFCINMAEAQHAGCTPFTFDGNALSEVVQSGYKFKLDLDDEKQESNFFSILIEAMLTHPKGKEEVITGRTWQDFANLVHERIEGCDLQVRLVRPGVPKPHLIEQWNSSSQNSDSPSQAKLRSTAESLSK